MRCPCDYKGLETLGLVIWIVFWTNALLKFNGLYFFIGWLGMIINFIGGHYYLKNGNNA